MKKIFNSLLDRKRKVCYKTFNMRKILLTLAIALSLSGLAHSACVEINLSTCVGDFAEGGDSEIAGRVLGNANTYYFSIIQGNYPRIFIASGTRQGGYGGAATPTTAGYVGIWTNGTTQIPQYIFDIWGTLRSTDSAFFATSNGMVGIGTIPVNSNFIFIVGSNTVVVTRTGNFGVGTSSPTSKFQILDGSMTVIGSVPEIGVNGTGANIKINGNPVLTTQTVVITTFTTALPIPGVISVATSPFVAIPGAKLNTARSTWNIIEVQIYCVTPSTVGATFFRLAGSTVTDGSTVFSYLSSTIEVSTSSNYSNWTSISSTTWNAQMTVTPHVVQVPTAAGNSTEECECNIRYWRKPDGQ